MNRNLQPGHFYGEVLRKRQDSGLILSELKHEAARKLPSHSHELGFFCLLLSGTYSEQFGKKWVNRRPLTVRFHPPGSTHVDEIGPTDAHFFNAELKPEWFDRLRDFGVSDLANSFHEGELAWLALRLYREYREFDACSPLTIEGLVLEMLAIVGRMRDTNKQHPPAWLSRAMDLLHSEFCRNLRVQDVAGEVGVHPFHLSRVFRKFHRETIGEYVNKLRVTYACRQLILPDIDLANVALAAGFADQSHFTRVFKNVTGVTPGVFKQIAAESRSSEWSNFLPKSPV